MNIVTIDISNVIKHFNKIVKNKPYEIFLVSYYEYPFVNKSINKFNSKMSTIFDCTVEEMLNSINIEVYNISVNSILGAIEIELNKNIDTYTKVEFSKIIETSDDKLLAEFKYE